MVWFKREITFNKSGPLSQKPERERLLLVGLVLARILKFLYEFLTILAAVYSSAILSGVLTQTTLLIIACHIVLSFVNLLTLWLSFSKEGAGFRELMYDLFGLIMVGCLFYVTAPHLIIASQFKRWLFYANVSAAAVNVFLPIRSFFIYLAFLGRYYIYSSNEDTKKTYSHSFIFRKEIEESTIKECVLNEFHRKWYGGLNDRNTTAIIDKINALRTYFLKKINKKHQSAVGFIVNQDAISKMIKLVDELPVDECNVKDVVSFIDVKLSRKKAKLSLLSKWKDELIAPLAPSDLSDQPGASAAPKYSPGLLRSFNNLSVKVDLSADDKSDCIKLIDDEIKSQKRKIAELNELLSGFKP